MLIVLLKEKLLCCNNCSFELCLLRQEMKQSTLKNKTDGVNDPKEFYTAGLIQIFISFTAR